MPVSPVITITREGEVIKSLSLENEVLIGRAEGCAIRLNDRAISRQHALFRLIGSTFQVEKRSEFGLLFVNGIECDQSLLKEGDSVALGPYLVRFSIPAESIVEVPPTVVAPVLNGDEVKLDSDLPSSDLKEESVLRVTNQVSDQALENFPSEPPFQELEAQEVSTFDPIDEDAQTKVMSSTKVVVKLLFEPGMANFTEFEVNQDEISIGRGKDCDIILNDKKSSRKNAIIRRSGLHFFIQDLDSANGTFVNKIRIKEKELSGDDFIRIGSVEFQFKALSKEYQAQEKNFMSLPEVPEILPEPQVNQPLPVEMDVIGMQSGFLGSSTKKQTLLEKFRAHPKQKQMIYGAFILCFAYFLMSGEDQQVVKKKTKKIPVASSPVNTVAPTAFESLSLEKKQFVESQHDLAFDYYKNKDYDKALDAIQKIFILVSDYKDSRDIERYAKEGKRKMEAIEEEKKRKEEEIAFKAKILQLEDDIRKKMEKKDYVIARELFSEILGLDPDNVSVSKWKQEIDIYEESVKNKERAREIQLSLNKSAWNTYKQGLLFKKMRKYHTAISVFQKIPGLGSSNKKLLDRSRRMIHWCRFAIRRLRDPILDEAKKEEDAGNLPKAFNLYKKATRADPYDRTGFVGMNRIKGFLHEQAKAIYTEAILAESYSDFSEAKKLFQKCLNTAPQDDIYYERAQRKIGHYFQKNEVIP